MAASNAIGSGSVILTANADPLAAGLDKAAAKVDQFAQKAQRAAAEVAKTGKLVGAGELGEKFGALGAGFGAGGLLAAGGVAIAGRLGKEGFAAAAGVTELNRQLEQSALLSAKVVDNFGKMAESVLKTATEGPLNRENALANLKREESNLSGLKEQLRGAREELQSLDGWMNRTIRGPIKDDLPLIGGIIAAPEQAKFDSAKQRFEEFTKLVATQEGLVTKLRDSLKAPAEIETFTKAIQAQAAAVGLSAEQLKLRELALKGASDKQLEAARREVEVLEQAKKSAEAAKAVDDLTKSLEKQAATFGMTAGQAAVFEAVQGGAQGAQLERLKAAAAETDRLAARAENVRKAFRAAFHSDKDTTSRKLGGALESGSAAAFSAVVKHSVSGMGSPGEQARKQTEATRDVARKVDQLIEVVKDKLSVVSL